MSALHRHFGIRWLANRALYDIRLRAGLLERRVPSRSWEDEPFGRLLGNPSLEDPERYLAYRRVQAPRFFFSSEQRDDYSTRLRKYDDTNNGPTACVAKLAQGVFPLFEGADAWCGLPPPWHANPLTGQRTPSERHWSRIRDFGFGDIKFIWELSRFSFVYPLVRAFWRTGDERCAELFWQLVDSWRESNLPQQGANWKCGQEISIRIMAWCFGLHGFLESSATTPARVAALGKMLAISANRVEANIHYALRQANNHGISEATGLWTVGTLFPEFLAADRWRDLGREVLEAEAAKLIYDDGSFVQHSVNYHRLMLHAYIWATRLADLAGQPFSSQLRARVGRAGDFLFQIQDETTGAVPYYGQNDGALILPLNNCGYHDFRPVVAATQFLVSGTRRFDPGPWDEDLLWLFGTEALTATRDTAARGDFTAVEGGYYTLRDANSFVFTRCASFQHRPSQADMLHVDLWWRGQNIAVDPGTFSYNASEPWDNALARTAYHNTVTVDDRSQMDQAGTFLWLPWLNSEVRTSIADRRFAYFEGSHDGYRRLSDPVTHRRGIVRLGDDLWVVLDSLEGDRNHRYRLHWLLPDVPYTWDRDRVTLRTAHGDYHVQAASLCNSGEYSVVRADPESPRGWRAPYYGYREPAVSFALTVHGPAVRFWTVLTARPCEVEANLDSLQIQMGTLSFSVLFGAGPQLVSSVRTGVDERVIRV